MKIILLASVLFSSAVLASEKTFKFDLNETNLAQAIPIIVSKLSNASEAALDTKPTVILNGKELNSFSQEDLQGLTTASLSKIEYLEPNAQYPNGLLVLGLNEL